MLTRVNSLILIKQSWS